MKLYFLGCNGWIPGANHTSCFAVENKGQLILLDAGTGTSNLIGFQKIFERYDEVSVILSHYHLDHIIGLMYLLPLLKNKTLNIYGPGKPAYPKTTHEYLKELFQSAFFSRDIDAFAVKVNFSDYSDSSFKIGDITVKTYKQEHTQPSFRIMLDNDIVYATDTSITSKNWEEQTNAKVLIHECWDIKSSEKNSHSSLEDILNILPLEKFDKVFLVHQNPLWDKLQKDAAANILSNNSKVKFANDGEELMF